MELKTADAPFGLQLPQPPPIYVCDLYPKDTDFYVAHNQQKARTQILHTSPYLESFFVNFFANILFILNQSK